MSSIEEFWRAISGIYGAYLDALSGFRALHGELKAHLAKYQAESGLPAENVQSMPFWMGLGVPHTDSNVALHVVPTGDVVRRNRERGENALILGATSVVAIYGFWEDCFRARIALELGRAELTHDALGDVRLLRHDIVHHRGIATKEITRCKVFAWFKAGDPIEIDEGRMHTIMLAIRRACDGWASEVRGAGA